MVILHQKSHSQLACIRNSLVKHVMPTPGKPISRRIADRAKINDVSFNGAVEQIPGDIHSGVMLDLDRARVAEELG